jgi:hypothetical protein
MNDDYEIEYDLACPKCNHSPIHSRDCINWCNEGYMDEYDDDPINNPEEGVSLYACRECKGTGIERWCPKCGENLSGHHFEEWDEENN